VRPEQNKLRVRSNAFNIHVPKPVTVYQYRIDIVGERPGREGPVPVSFNDDTIAA
jgi:hypothetical protein